MVKIVKVKGGAGNQLFQASHVFASLSSPDERVILVTYRLQNDPTKNSLFDPAWSVFNTETQNGLGPKLLLKLSQLPPVAAILKWMNIDCVDGYFQEDVDLDYAQLAKSAVEEAAVGKPPSVCGVIHCRGGDYLVPPNDTIYWKMSLSDYEAALSTESLTDGWMVLGNHQGLIPELEHLGAVQVQGSTCEDLSLMGAAQRVVCSNSTFAFWGAVFCLLNGGRGVVPERYYYQGIAPNPFDVLLRKFPDRVSKYGGDHD